MPTFWLGRILSRGVVFLLADHPGCPVKNTLEGTQVKGSNKISQKTLAVVRVRNDNGLELMVTVAKARSDAFSIHCGS